MTQEEKYKATARSMAEELKPEVLKIEGGIKTTQNNYGRYMSLILQLTETIPQSSYEFWALTLIYAGANKRGVTDALRGIKG